MGSEISVLPVVVALLGVVVSVGLLVWLRGRRVACPPSCGRCGYDVSRRPADSARCSECGADLAGPGAVVTERRTRPVGVTAAAAVVVGVAMLYFGYRATGFDWRTWYMLRASNERVASIAEGGTGAWSRQALEHWLARDRDQKLSAAERARLIEHLLAWQADTGRPWELRMGDVLFGALRAQELTPAQAERFVRNAFPGVTFRARSPIRVGDPVPFTYAAGGGFRGGSGMSFTTTRWALASFAGPPEIRDDRDWSAGTWGGQASTELATAKAAGTGALAPGRHTLHVLLGCEVTSGTSGRGTAISPRVRWRQTLEVDAVAAGSPAGEAAAAAPEMADAVARSLDLGVYRWPDGRLFARVALRDAPVDRAFDVFVEHDGKRHLVARRYATANGSSSFHSAVDYVPIKDSPELKTLTFVAVGSAEALADSVDQRRYWPGMIVFPRVPVGKQGEAYSNRPAAELEYEVAR